MQQATEVIQSSQAGGIVPCAACARSRSVFFPTAFKTPATQLLLHYLKFVNRLTLGNCPKHFLLLAISSWMLLGCVSLETCGSDGKPRVAGFAKVEASVEVAEGQICRVRTPGISLCFHKHAPILTIGYRDSLYFYPVNDNEQPEKMQPAAVFYRISGCGTTGSSLFLGQVYRFEVAAPPSGESVVRYISFNEQNVEKTIIRERKL